ncbi:MAG: alpha-L-fucosidase, partial [Marinoscillum sp.]
MLIRSVFLIGILLSVRMIMGQELENGAVDTGDKYADAALIKYESPEQISKRLEWWAEARFGMFIHWGLYAHDGCHWNGQYGRSEHMMMKLQIPIKEYERIADDFNPIKFDAEEWVKIAKSAGMKYMVITAKHHDGYAMFDSPSSDYDIVDHSKWKQDPVKQLAEACKKHGLKFGVYYSLGRDWHDPNCNSSRGGWRSNTWDYPDEEAKILEKYIEGKVKPQLTELLNQYDPAIIWFDTPELVTREQSLEILKLIHDINPDCIVNQRIGNRLGD